MTLLQVENLSYAIRRQPLLEEISFSLQAGEILGLVGPNGAGKSTLLKLCAGVLPVTQGSITLRETPLQRYAARKRAQQIAYIAQNVTPAWPLTVENMVALGRTVHGIPMDRMEVGDILIVDRALRATKIDAFAHRPIQTLSGGEQARVWLARAMATEAPILLADEPTAGLDMYYQLLFMEQVQHWRQEGRAAIIAIHDLSLAARFCDRLLVLSHGKRLGLAPPQQLLEQHVLETAFQVTLHSVTVNGSPLISPVSILSACPFQA